MKKILIVSALLLFGNFALQARRDPIVIHQGGAIDDRGNQNRTYGDVIITNGTEYEIESSGTVTLEDGFEVEKGATFAVYPASF